MQTKRIAGGTEPQLHDGLTNVLVCYLIILRSHDSQALFLRDGPRLRLPMVEIPTGERVPPHVLPQVQAKWELTAVCRFSVPVDQIMGTPMRYRCYVLEALGGGAAQLDEAVWIEVSEIDERNIEPLESHELLRLALAQASGYSTTAIPDTFVQADWFGEVSRWVQIQLNPHKLELAVGHDQYNMGPSFSLLRFATNGPAVWFKAVGEPNLREYAITTELRKLESPHLPKILAMHIDWHGWLMLEESSTHLDEVWDLASWQNVARSLAELQVGSRCCCDALLAAGSLDLRLERLRSRISPYLDLIARLMKLQSANPPRALVAADLELIEKHLHLACERLEALALPNTLGTTDVSPGNVLVSGDRAIFIDWAEANVSLPLLTLEYFLVLLRRLRPDLDSWTKPILDAYCGPWRSLLSAEQIFEAYRWTPLVAIFVFSLACLRQQHEVEGMKPALVKLLRSLARSMHVEAKALQGFKLSGTREF